MIVAVFPKDLRCVVRRPFTPRLASVNLRSDAGIEKPHALVSVYAARPLELAVETATINLMDWLITEHGLTPTDAYCLVSTCPDFRINVYQMCKIARLSYVAGAELPRRYLRS